MRQQDVSLTLHRAVSHPADSYRTYMRLTPAIPPIIGIGEGCDRMRCVTNEQERIPIVVLRLDEQQDCARHQCMLTRCIYVDTEGIVVGEQAFWLDSPRRIGVIPHAWQ